MLVFPSHSDMNWPTDHVLHTRQCGWWQGSAFRQVDNVPHKAANSAHPPAAWQGLCQQEGCALTPFPRQVSNPHPEQICQRNYQNHDFKMTDTYIWIMVGLSFLLYKILWFNCIKMCPEARGCSEMRPAPVTAPESGKDLVGAQQQLEFHVSCWQATTQLPSWTNWLGSHSNSSSIPANCRTSADEKPLDLSQTELYNAQAEVHGAGSHIPHLPQHPALSCCPPSSAVNLSPPYMWELWSSELARPCWKLSDNQALQQVSR